VQSESHLIHCVFVGICPHCQYVATSVICFCEKGMVVPMVVICLWSESGRNWTLLSWRKYGMAIL